MLKKKCQMNSYSLLSLPKFCSVDAYVSFKILTLQEVILCTYNSRENIVRTDPLFCRIDPLKEKAFCLPRPLKPQSEFDMLSEGIGSGV